MTGQFIRDHCTRYAINVPVTYDRVNGHASGLKNGWARDLNLRGAWVELPEPARLGSVLAITLATPARDVWLVAHVVWARPQLPNAPYLHGLRFTGVTSTQRDGLSTLLAQHKPLPLRLYCALAATCRQKGVECAAIAGTTRDLSNDGACVRLPTRVDPGTELCVRVASRFGQIVADAQVVWRDRAQADIRHDALYRHGLRFLQIHPLSDLPLRALLDGIP